MHVLFVLYYRSSHTIYFSIIHLILFISTIHQVTIYPITIHRILHIYTIHRVSNRLIRGKHVFIMTSIHAHHIFYISSTATKQGRVLALVCSATTGSNPDWRYRRLPRAGRAIPQASAFFLPWPSTELTGELSLLSLSTFSLFFLSPSLGRSSSSFGSPPSGPKV